MSNTIKEILQTTLNKASKISYPTDGSLFMAESSRSDVLEKGIREALKERDEEIEEYRAKLEQYRFHPQLNIEIGLFLERHDRKYTPKDKEE